jgi:phosphoglucosamine mutase
MRQLFGTDGIRAKAHEFPLDPATMYALGTTLVRKLQRAGIERPRILLGMDTRESGPEIARSLAAGIANGGGETVLAGVVPTPAVAFLCHTNGLNAGISISASHNPWEDNGVKVFGGDGMKLSDELEHAIEQELLAERKEIEITATPVEDSLELIEKYEQFLLASIAPGALAGKKVVLDTGNGAAYRIAGEAFRRAGAEVIVIHDAPNGTNINAGCGALHPEGLGERVVREKADFGVAFDGDADRAIFVDDTGAIRNGDEILYLWARREKSRGRLKNDTLVATVMSNFGFEAQLARDGVRLLRSQVGDKYVLETMMANGAVLGGEQSGHIIDLNVHTTGDGLHTALAIGELIAESGRKFSELETFEPMPQVLVNQKVRSKPPLDTLSQYKAAVEDAERALGGKGRVLVRYSGTENLVRVMVEGDDSEKISLLAEQLRASLASEIGA